MLNRDDKLFGVIIEDAYTMLGEVKLICLKTNMMKMVSLINVLIFALDYLVENYEVNLEKML